MLSCFKDMQIQVRILLFKATNRLAFHTILDRYDGVMARYSHQTYISIEDTLLCS